MKRVIGARKAMAFENAFVPRLRELLDDVFYEVRAYAAKSLGKLEVYDAIPKITPLLFDEVEEVRYSSAEALGHFRDGQVILPLLRTLSDHSRETRRLATLSLKAQDEVHLRQVIFAWLDQLVPSDYDMMDEDAIQRIDVSRGIMEACGVFGFTWVDEILRRGLHSPDLEMQRLAAISIGQLQLDQFSEELLDRRAEEDDDVRMGLIYGLSQLDFPDKLDVLRQYCDDSFEFIRQLLASELPRQYPPDLISDEVNNFLEDDLALVRASLAQNLREESYLDHLTELLEDPYDYVRKEAAISLGMVSHPRSLEALQETEETDDLVIIAIDNSISDLKKSLPLQ